MPKKRLPGEAPLPPAPRLRRQVYDTFYGLDLRASAGAGGLVECSNFDPCALPALSALCAMRYTYLGFSGCLSVSVIADNLLILHRQGDALWLFRRRPDGGEEDICLPLYDPLDAERFFLHHNIDAVTDDCLDGNYRHTAILYPDMLCFDLDDAVLSPYNYYDRGSCPLLEHGCMHLSRVFGTAGDRILASGYNAPGDFYLTDSQHQGPASAWAVTVQANNRSHGKFTAICSYEGNILAFKRDFCHILYNNKAPFRVGDLMPVGVLDHRSLAEVDGALFFVGQDGVYRYNGSEAKRISDPLGQVSFEGAVATGAGGIYYLYLPDTKLVYLYAEKNGMWSSISTLANSSPVTSMTTDGKSCWMLTEAGHLYCTTKEGRNGSFALRTGPWLNTERGRVCHLTLSVTTKNLSVIEVVYIDTAGREKRLVSAKPRIGTSVIETRNFTPSDYGGSLYIFGQGELTLHSFTLTTSET